MRSELVQVASLLAVGVVTFKLTQTHYLLKNKVSLLEEQISTTKERLGDLELFKLKVYSNDITIGRRAWMK